MFSSVIPPSGCSVFSFPPLPSKMASLNRSPISVSHLSSAKVAVAMKFVAQKKHHNIVSRKGHIVTLDKEETNRGHLYSDIKSLHHQKYQATSRNAKLHPCHGALSHLSVHLSTYLPRSPFAVHSALHRDLEGLHVIRCRRSALATWQIRYAASNSRSSSEFDGANRMV